MRQGTSREQGNNIEKSNRKDGEDAEEPVRRRRIPLHASHEHQHRNEPGRRPDVADLADQRDQKIGRMEQGATVRQRAAGLEGKGNPPMLGVPDRDGHQSERSQSQREPRSRGHQMLPACPRRQEKRQGGGAEQHRLIFRQERDAERDARQAPPPKRNVLLITEDFRNEGPDAQQQAEIEGAVRKDEMTRGDEEKGSDGIPCGGPEPGNLSIGTAGEIEQQDCRQGPEKDIGQSNDKSAFAGEQIGHQSGQGES